MDFSTVIFGVSSIVLVKLLVDMIKYVTGANGKIVVLISIMVSIALNVANYFAGINPVVHQVFSLIFYGLMTALSSNELYDAIKAREANSMMIKYVVALPEAEQAEPSATVVNNCSCGK